MIPLSCLSFAEVLNCGPDQQHYDKAHRNSQTDVRNVEPVGVRIRQQLHRTSSRQIDTPN